MSSFPVTRRQFLGDAAGGFAALALGNITPARALTDEKKLTKKEDVEIHTFQPGTTWRGVKGTTMVQIENKTGETKTIKAKVALENPNWSINGGREEEKDVVLPPNTITNILFLPQASSSEDNATTKETLTISDTSGNELHTKETTHRANSSGRFGQGPPIPTGFSSLEINSKNLKAFPIYDHEIAAWNEIRPGHYYKEDGDPLEKPASKELTLKLGEVKWVNKMQGWKKEPAKGWKIEAASTSTQAEPLGVGTFPIKITPPPGVGPGTYEIQYELSMDDPRPDATEKVLKTGIRNITVEVK